MTGKLAIHWQQLPGWCFGVTKPDAFKYAKVIDPPGDDPFPGVHTIGRTYIPDGQSNNLIKQGAAGAVTWYNTFLKQYDRCKYIWAWEGPNEPGVATQVDRANLVAFTNKWVSLMHAHVPRLRTVVLCLSVGWPDVGTAHELAGALDETDYWAVHEYSAPSMQTIQGGLCLRYRKTVEELQVAGSRIPPLLITECGIDGGVAGKPQKGWKTFTDRAGYMSQLSWYNSELMKDSYVEGATIFTGGPNGDWQDFEVDQPLAQMIVAYNRSVPDTPPVIITDPFVVMMQQEFGSNFVDLRASLPTNPQSPYWPYPKRSLDGIQRYTIHHSASPSATTTWQGVATYHTTDPDHLWPGIGYCIGVGPDGKVSLLNDLTTASYHDGTTATPWDDNVTDLGICMLGNFQPNVVGIPEEHPTPQAVDALKCTVGVLDKFLKRQPEIIGHRDVAHVTPAGTECPGNNLEVLLPTLRGTMSDPVNDIRNGTWNRVNIPLNPSAAFYQYAKANNLGGPRTPEFEVVSGGQTYVVQAYDVILYCVKPNYSDIKQVSWL